MIELTEIQKEIKELILDTPPPGKHCARSAIRHIEKAWEIKDIDREMSGFRAITGEEESVTAIFHSLKRRNYKASDKLKLRDHVHKSAMHPFLIAVSQAFDPVKAEMQPVLELHTESDSKRFRVRVIIKGPDGKDLWVFPDPPLNFNVKVNDKPLDFSDQFSLMATEKNAKDMFTAIKKAANYRNQILYASQNGIPSLLDPIDKYLLKRKDIIFLNLAIFLLIDPYREIQLFAQQALAAFLKMLNVIDDMNCIIDW
jgi:hypothetical protein